MAEHETTWFESYGETIDALQEREVTHDELEQVLFDLADQELCELIEHAQSHLVDGLRLMRHRLHLSHARWCTRRSALAADSPVVLSAAISVLEQRE